MGCVCVLETNILLGYREEGVAKVAQTTNHIPTPLPTFRASELLLPHLTQERKWNKPTTWITLILITYALP